MSQIAAPAPDVQRRRTSHDEEIGRMAQFAVRQAGGRVRALAAVANSIDRRVQLLWLAAQIERSVTQLAIRENPNGAGQ